MKAVVQRVSRASVMVDDEVVAEIERGLLVLLGLEKGDDPEDIANVARRLPRRRFFTDGEGKMNLSLLDVEGSVLLVSQFTLAADLEKGLRPAFTRAMEPEIAEPLCAGFAEAIREQGVNVREGRFGAKMDVELVNDGPVTFMFETVPTLKEPKHG